MAVNRPGSVVEALSAAGAGRRAVGRCQGQPVGQLRACRTEEAARLLAEFRLQPALGRVADALGAADARPTYELMRDCDTLLMIGSSFPYSQVLPDYDQARA